MNENSNWRTHVFTDGTTPIEAALACTIAKRRRETADFPGGARMLAQLAEGATRRRVGLLPDGRAPAREGAAILGPDGAPIGAVTSGGFSPTLERPIAMGYVVRDFAKPDTALALDLRGKPVAAQIVRMPFVAANYYRGS